MSRVVSALLLCGVLLAASACGERSEPTGAAVDAYPVTVTGAQGDPTRVAVKPVRILAGPEMAATLRALGVRATVGDGQADVPPGRFDLVLTWASADSFLRGPRQSDAVYVAADRSLDDVERSITEIGLLVGRPLAARRLAGRIRASRTGLAARLRTTSPITVFLDTGLFRTVSTRSLAGDMIAEAGGENIAGPRPEPEPFDLRVLASRNPEYYLATSDSGTTLAGLRRNSRTRRLDAVKDARFGIIAASLLEPGPNVGRGVVEIARLLHPDAFR